MWLAARPLLNILCRRRNEQLAAAEARHVDPLATNIEEPERHLLASGQEVEAASMAPPDLSLVQQRIKDIKALLENFKVGLASLKPHSQLLAHATHVCSRECTPAHSVPLCAFISHWQRSRSGCVCCVRHQLQGSAQPAAAGPICTVNFK